MFSGNELLVEPVRQSNGLVELSIDMQRSSVNKLDAALLAELEAAVRRLEQHPSIRGLMITSAKPAFVVGADVFAFPALFEGEPDELADWLAQTHDLFNRLETLPFPTVAAVNGFALGGGFELALTADARVVAKSTKVGLPEVNLGLCPGWGGRCGRVV